jgi:predicted RNase H-like HicB family nuclease
MPRVRSERQRRLVFCIMGEVSGGNHMEEQVRITVIQREGDVYVARCPELEVQREGDTIEDATASLREAITFMLEAENPEDGDDPQDTEWRGS